MNQCVQQSAVVSDTVSVSAMEMKTRDTRPTSVKNLMVALNCDPQWYTSKFKGGNFVIHPIPWTTLKADVQVSQSPGRTTEWGELPKRPSVGAVDCSTSGYRFGTPWSPGRQTFRHHLDEIQSRLGAKHITDESEHPGNGQWYRFKDKTGDRLWYETTDQSTMIHEVTRYMVILQQL